MASETITAMTRDDTGFYDLLGPFLADRAVHQYLGGPPWDDEGKTWLIARTRGNVTGFAAYRTERAIAVIESCYSVDADEVVQQRLVTAAVDATTPSPVRATVRREHAGPYLAAGLLKVGETTNFIKLARKG